MNGLLVSIMGPVGVGKTTLARWLAGQLPARLIEEYYQGNPYLEDACAGHEQARLPAQAYFLLSRARQLDGRRLDGLAVSDYAFCQDAIFAGRSLSGDDLRAYGRLARRVAAHVQPPAVVIHLDAREPTLLARVANRGRPFERALDAAFLSYLRRRYRKAAAQLACPVLSVDCERTDLLADGQRRALLEQVREALRPAEAGRTGPGPMALGRTETST